MLYILDAYALIYRCYFAFGGAPLIDSKGRNTAAIFGVFNTLHSFFHKYKPSSFVAAFDSRTPTFRHELYGPYKANRAAAPDDLHAQVPWIEEALRALGAPCLQADGYEADDIIATISKKCTDTGLQCRILTGDKDLCALVNGNTHLLRPPKRGDKKGEWQEIDALAVEAEWGVKTAQMTDLLALMGDASDNIPGVKGVGEKTAAKYLCLYGTLENVLSHADEVKGAAGEKLRAGIENAMLSKKLVQLKYDVPIAEEECQKEPVWDYAKCADVLEMYELKTLSAKWRALGGHGGNAARSLAAVRYGGNAAVSPTTATDGIKDEPSLFSASSPASHADSTMPPSLPPCSSAPAAYSLSPDSCPMPPVTCSMLSVAAWLLESDKPSYTLESLAEEEGLDAADESTKGVLMERYSKALKARSLMALFTGLEVPLISVLRDMEKRGIHVDTKALGAYNKELTQKIEALEKEIYSLSGHEFNIGSPKQLMTVLYDEMGLTPEKQSTDAATLDALKDFHPIVSKVLEWREYTKLRSTYVDTLPRLADSGDRVHTTFVQTGTATGRLSSRDPNLQNIPVRTEEGRRIRSAFTAPAGRALVSADYSQIELVVLAHLSGDENMKAAFKSGVDIHRTTAATIFEGASEITAQMRRAAKTINFGVIYGMSAFRLARDLGISRGEAAEFIKKYFAAYPAIQVFKAASIQMAEAQGYVTTIMGRPRYVRGLDSGNRMAREAAQRICVNTRVQGSAADIMKKAMLDVDTALKQSGMDASLLLQVHDELILECDKDDAERVSELVKDKMEKAVVLSVPLRVSVETGDNWGSFH